MADQPTDVSASSSGPRQDFNLADSLRLLIAEVANDETLANQVNTIRSRHDIQVRIATTLGEPADTPFDRAQLMSLLVTAANGSAELPTQSVIVEYLRTDQRLLIPAPLGYCMANLERHESRATDTLVARFFRVAATPYATLRPLVTTSRNYAHIRETIDAIVVPAQFDYTKSWIYDVVPKLSDEVLENPDQATVVMSTLSVALQMNCDVRDMGFLSSAVGRVYDAAWSDISTVQRSRLRSYLRPFTLQNIAALNYNAVARNPLAAWVRAYGISAGILAHPTSLTQIEYVYTYAFPSLEDRMAVTSYETKIRFNIFSVCLNVLAMFGLLHLAKDHTFKSADPNMERICTSWVLTLRTLIPTDDMDAIKTNLEPICRTAAHPFGLAQTYWLARVMHKFGQLAAPLMIRIAQTPPPVQRVMIVRAATREWESMAAGKLLNDLFRRHLEAINIENDKIKAQPPAYSGLHRLYAVDDHCAVSQEATDACGLLMPAVYGFAMALHVDDDRKKDGLALALSLENVVRDHKVLAKSFEAIWSSYLDSVAKMGLAEFIHESARLTGMELGGGM